MRNLLLILFLFHLTLVHGQANSKKIRISQLGWTLVVSERLTKTDSVAYTKDQIDKALGKITQGGFFPFQVVLIINREDDNNLIVTIHSRDSSDNLWNLLRQSSKQTIIDLIKEPQPELTVTDTSKTSLSIDGTLFDNFSFRLIDKKNNKTIDNYWWYGVYKGWDISFSLSSTDNSFATEYLKILLESRFNR